MPEPQFDHTRQTVVPAVKFDDSHFSKRELRLMEQIAGKYRSRLSKDMVEVTHAENGAWEKVWDGGRGFNNRIDYELV